MAQSMAVLTQSQFYSPCLNGAIFDGPFKIFFSQEQEALGLSIYFQLQKKLGEIYTDIKSQFKESYFNIYIMIYPSDKSFKAVKNENELEPGFFEGNVKENLVIGINKEVTGDQLGYLYTYLKEKMDTNVITLSKLTI